jgi:hypothetical protein
MYNLRMWYEDSEIDALKTRLAKLETEVAKIKAEASQIKHVAFDVKEAVIDLSGNTRDHVTTLYQYLGNLFEQTRPLLDQLEKSDQGAMGPIIREIKTGVINFLEERERRKGSGVTPPPKSQN